jgi:hypothetical protein
MRSFAALRAGLDEQQRAIESLKRRVLENEYALRMVESDLRGKRREIQQLISELARRHLVAKDIATRLTSTETDLEYVTAPFNGRLLSGYRPIRQPSVPSPDGAPVATPATECPVLPRSPGKYDMLCFPIIDWRFRFQRPQQLCTRFARMAIESST